MLAHGGIVSLGVVNGMDADLNRLIGSFSVERMLKIICPWNFDNKYFCHEQKKTT